MEQLIASGTGIYAFDSGYVRRGLAAVHLIVENGRVVKASLRLEDVVDLTMRAPRLPPPKLVRRLYDRMHQRFSHEGKPPAEPAAK